MARQSSIINYKKKKKKKNNALNSHSSDGLFHCHDSNCHVGLHLAMTLLPYENLILPANF